MSAPKRKRRWYQFSLRTLLVFLLLVSILLSWFAVKRQRATRQREAVAAIREAGACVFYDYEVKEHWEHFGADEPPIPAPLRELLGVDFFSDVVIAGSRTWTFDDDDMIHLKELTSLKELNLTHSQVSDNGLRHLEKLTNLERLGLRNTQITDAGMRHLRQLTNLKELNLSCCRHVSDAGLQELEGLTNLRALFIDGTGVSKEGFKRLQQALPRLKYSIFPGRVEEAHPGVSMPNSDEGYEQYLHD